MGYIIEFNVEISGVYKKDKDKLAEDIKVLCPEFTESLKNNKWPDRHEELGDLTFKYPDIEIMVSCIGENEARWQERYKDGEWSMVDFRFRDEW